MSSEVPNVLSTAVPRDVGEPDIGAAWQRGHQLRGRRRIRNGLIGVLGFSALAAVAVVTVDAEPSRVSVPPASSEEFVDSVQAFSVDIPDGWHRAQGVLLQNPGPSQYELLAASTRRLPSIDTLAPFCGGTAPLPSIALRLGRGDALVYVLEGFGSRGPGGVTSPPVMDFRTRPERFKGTPMLDTNCVVPQGREDFTFRHLYFSDQGRIIGVHVVWGPDVSVEHKAETWALLDSLHFDPVPPGPKLRAYQDDRNGFTVQIPGDWAQEEIHAPGDLLSISTPELIDIGCGAATSAVYVSVHESNINAAGNAEVETRTDRFGPSSGSTDASGASSVNGCEVPESTQSQRIFFTDNGRFFQVFINFQSAADPARLQQAYDLLNSMHFQPAGELDRGRPPTEVRVFLLNGSGHPTAVTAAEQNLKGFGFDVLGSKHTPKTSVTTIACLKRYAMDAYNVSLVFGPTAVIKPALRHAIKGTQRADCVVTLGTSAGFSLPSGAPQEIEVVVLNGSDQTGAGAAVTNELRGLGYAVVRTGNTTPRDGTVIACRQKFADEAELIADVVGRDAMVQDASSVPEFEAGFDCIVLLGG